MPQMQRKRKKRMIRFACKTLKHKPWVRFQKKQAEAGKPLSDGGYCNEMLPKIVHRTDIAVDVALDVSERCTDKVMMMQNKKEFMSKLPSKVETKKEVDTLREWEKRQRLLPCPPGTKCSPANALNWAQNSIEITDLREEVRG